MLCGEIKMKLRKIVVLMALALPSAASIACSSCGCSLNTDIGTQGMGMTEGWTLDIRYDALNQNKLRSGTKPISQSAAAATGNEVENYTQNNYVTGSLDYNNGESWGVTAISKLLVATLALRSKRIGAYSTDLNYLLVLAIKQAV
jgi:hypothetical protein